MINSQWMNSVQCPRKSNKKLAKAISYKIHQKFFNWQNVDARLSTKYYQFTIFSADFQKLLKQSQRCLTKRLNVITELFNIFTKCWSCTDIQIWANHSASRKMNTALVLQRNLFNRHKNAVSTHLSFSYFGCSSMTQYHLAALDTENTSWTVHWQ